MSESTFPLSRPSPSAYNTPDEAIARLQLSFEGIAARIAQGGVPCGELSFELRFSGQPDAVGSGLTAPKLQIRFSHHHWKSGDSEAKGLEYHEVLEEFLRRLQREISLKQLEAKRS